MAKPGVQGPRGERGRRRGRLVALLLLAGVAALGRADVLPVPAARADGDDALPSADDLREEREALAASLPADAEEAAALGAELRDLCARAWRLHLEALPRLEVARGWRRDRLAWEVGRAFPDWVRGRLATADRRAGGKVAWPALDPIRSVRERVHAVNEGVRRLRASGAAAPKPLPESLPGGPGVPSPEDVRALTDLLAAEVDARRDHRAWTPDTQGDEGKVVEAVRARFLSAVERNRDLVEAWWGIADLAKQRALPSAAEDRDQAVRATREALARIRDSRLPFAAERVRALEGRLQE